MFVLMQVSLLPDARFKPCIRAELVTTCALPCLPSLNSAPPLHAHQLPA